jgi:hypothetical protein
MDEKSDYKFINVSVVELDKIIDDEMTEFTGALLSAYAIIPASDYGSDPSDNL